MFCDTTPKAAVFVWIADNALESIPFNDTGARESFYAGLQFASAVPSENLALGAERHGFRTVSAGFDRQSLPMRQNIP
jgi:hypothetical protein